MFYLNFWFGIDNWNSLSLPFIKLFSGFSITYTKSIPIHQYSPSASYVLSILNSEKKDEKEQKSLPSWSLHYSGKIDNKKIKKSII